MTQFSARPTRLATGRTGRGFVVALAATLVSFAGRAGDLGYPGSALKVFEQKPRFSYDGAPPLGRHSSDHPSSDLHASKNASASVAPKKTTVEDERASGCFVKIDGRVILNGPCRITHDGEKGATLEVDDKPLVITFREGRRWSAAWDGRDLGPVYKKGACWGAKRFYACERSM